MKLWTAQTISQVGTQVTSLALPLVAILVLRASPLQVGLLAAIQLLPFLLVGLPAGAWVDRMPRRPILMTCDIGSALLLGSIPVAFLAWRLTLTHLFVVALLKGILAVFHDVAYQAYLPSLVPPERLLAGNARLEISRSGAQLTGPGLATGLIRAVNAPMAIAADAASFVGSALFVLLIKREEPQAPTGGSRPELKAQIGEGLRYVLRQELLLPIAITTATSNLLLSMSGAVSMVFILRELHVPAGVLGAVFGMGNIGFVVGALTATRIPRWLGLGRTMCLGAATFGLPLVLVALAPAGHRAVPFLVVSGFIASFSSVVYSTNQVSLRQAITPEALQGRMNATMKFMVIGAMPIGSLIGGVLGASIGLRPTIWIAAVATSVAFVPLALSPVRSLRAIPIPARSSDN